METVAFNKLVWLLFLTSTPNGRETTYFLVILQSAVTDVRWWDLGDASFRSKTKEEENTYTHTQQDSNLFSNLGNMGPQLHIILHIYAASP
jgi:hypothetical protein